MDLGGGTMDLQETQSVVGLHVDADELTMDEQQTGVELVAGGQQQDWCHVSQAPMQVGLAGRAWDIGEDVVLLE